MGIYYKYPTGANIIMPLIVFGMFIPYQSILLPLFQFMQRRSVRGLPGLILVHVVYGLPITTLLFRASTRKSLTSSWARRAWTGPTSSGSSDT